MSIFDHIKFGDGLSVTNEGSGVIRVDGGAVVDNVPYTIFDAKGDILVASAADAASRLAVGTNGQVLTADSAQGVGVKWATPSSVDIPSLDAVTSLAATDEFLLSHNDPITTPSFGISTPTPPSSSTTGNLDRIYLSPITISGGDLSVSLLHARVDGSGTCRLVVYAANGPSSGPGTLVCYTANLTCSGGGTVVTDLSGAPTVATVLTNGVTYWVGIHFGSNANVLGTSLGAFIGTTNFVTGATFASGAPATFSTTPNVSATMYIYSWVTGTSGTGTVLNKKITAANLGVSLGKTMEVKAFDDATAVTTGDGKVIFCVPASMNGMNLISAHAFVTTWSSSGLPTVQIRNITKSADMLSTRITIDVTEYTSYSAAASHAVDSTRDDVSTGDLLAVDVDVAGTGARGLGVILTFALP